MNEDTVKNDDQENEKIPELHTKELKGNVNNKGREFYRNLTQISKEKIKNQQFLYKNELHINKKTGKCIPFRYSNYQTNKDDINKL